MMGKCLESNWRDCSVKNVLYTIILFSVVALLPVSAWSQKYQTLGPVGCGVGQNNCHAGDNKNMIDKHKNSVDDIADSEDARKYAELSGIGAANYLKGTSKCMECHGTIISGKESKDVEEGVSCESCHGPGSGYKDVHQEGKYAPGTIRPGYTKSLPLGLLDVKQDLNVRAKMCVRCHYLTDQKILAAGHPSGEKFNYRSGMKSVAKHWRHPITDEDQNVKYFADAKKARGPATAGSARKPAPSSSGTASVPQAVAAQSVAGSDQEGDSTPRQRVRKPPPPPKPVPADVSAAPPPPKEPIVLPPFPSITDSTRVDSVLLLLKQRLELLYKKTGG